MQILLEDLFIKNLPDYGERMPVVVSHNDIIYKQLITGVKSETPSYPHSVACDSHPKVIILSTLQGIYNVTGLINHKELIIGPIINDVMLMIIAIIVQG